MPSVPAGPKFDVSEYDLEMPPSPDFSVLVSPPAPVTRARRARAPRALPAPPEPEFDFEYDYDDEDPRPDDDLPALEPLPFPRETRPLSPPVRPTQARRRRMPSPPRSPAEPVSTSPLFVASPPLREDMSPVRAASRPSRTTRSRVAAPPPPLGPPVSSVPPREDRSPARVESRPEQASRVRTAAPSPRPGSPVVLAPPSRPRLSQSLRLSATSPLALSPSARRVETPPARGDSRSPSLPSFLSPSAAPVSRPALPSSPVAPVPSSGTVVSPLRTPQPGRRPLVTYEGRASRAASVVSVGSRAAPVLETRASPELGTRFGSVVADSRAEDDGEESGWEE